MTDLLSKYRSVDLGSVLGETEDASVTGLDEKRQKATVSLETVADKNPAQEAQADATSRRTGIPKDTVIRNPKRAEALERYRDLDLDALFREAPTTGEFISDPENAAQASDDIENLSGVERAIRSAVLAPTKLGKAFGRGMAMNELGELGFKQLRDFDPRRAREIARLEERLRHLQPGEEGFVDEWLDPAAEIFGQMMGGLATTGDEALQGAAVGAMGAAAMGQMGPQVAAPEEVLTVPAGAIAGFGYGISVGMATHAFRVEAGHAYLEMLEIRGVNGEKIDPTVAGYAAYSVGTVNAALEMIGLGAVADAARPVLKRWTSAYVKDALKNPTTARAIMNFGRRYAQAWGGEVSTEVLQEIVTMEAAEIAKQLSEGDFKEMTQDEWNERLGEIFSKVGRGMAILAMPGPAGSLALDLSEVRRTQKQTQRLEQLRLATEASSLRANNPQAFRELLEKMASDAGTETVYVDPQGLQTLMQSAPMPPEQMQNQAVELMMADLPKALEEGRAIEVPVHDFATDIIGTELAAQIMPHVSLEYDALTEAEASQLGVQDEIVRQAQLIEAREQSETTVADDLTWQLVRAGWEPSTAQQNADFFVRQLGNMARKAGLELESLAQEYGLTVGREVDPALQEQARAIENLDLMIDRIRAGDMGDVRQARGPTLLEFYAERGGLVDTGGELANLDLDADRVGRNRIIREGGEELDMAGRYAEEAGYPVTEDPQTVIDAIASELRGEPVYSAEQIDTEAVYQMEALEELAELLESSGINIQETSNETIKRILTERMSEDVLMQEQAGQVEIHPGDRDAEGRLLAPNGQPSNLTEHLWRVVRTPAFINWFGDWQNNPEQASKVVDENGEPLVQYHGTGFDFDQFRYADSMGFHFGSLTAANTMARHRMSGKFKDGDGRIPMSSRSGTSLMPVFLNIRNPLELSDHGEWLADEVLDTLINMGVLTSDDEVADIRYDINNTMWADSATGDGSLPGGYWGDILQEKGYDGIVYINEFENPHGDFYAGDDMFMDQVVMDDNNDYNATGLMVSSSWVAAGRLRGVGGDKVTAYKVKKGGNVITEAEYLDMISNEEIIQGVDEGDLSTDQIDQMLAYRKVDAITGSEFDSRMYTLIVNPEMVEVIGPTEGAGKSWVAFEPTQIKSTMNIGEFDPNNPSILRQSMEPLVTPAPLAPDQAFGEIEYTEEVNVGGQVVEIKMPAQRAYDQTRKRRNVVNEVLKCVT